MAKYVIVEKSADYNDEIYILSDGYEIKSKLYNSVEEARVNISNHILRLFTDWKGNFNPSSFDFGSYNYDPPSEELVDYINSIGGNIPKDQSWDIHLPSTATHQECIKAYELSGLDLFNIIEIEE